MSKQEFRQWLVAGIAFGSMSVGVAMAEELKIDNLPGDPKAYRTQVERIIGQVDTLIAKLRGQGSSPALLDLLQTRDNVLREVPKVESAPDGSKWTSREARESVDAMLRLLKQQYEKTSS